MAEQPNVDPAPPKPVVKTTVEVAKPQDMKAPEKAEAKDGAKAAAKPAAADTGGIVNKPEAPKGAIVRKPATEVSERTKAEMQAGQDHLMKLRAAGAIPAPTPTKGQGTAAA